MPEERGLYPGMLVGEQLQYLGRLHGMTRSTPRARRHLAGAPGIADRAASKVEVLSTGTNSACNWSPRCSTDPELLVLDEPLAGLDPSGIDAIGEVLAEQARSGCCVLFSSHQLDQVEDLCESVVIIDHGHLVVAGRVDELASSGPRRLVVRVEGDRALPGPRESPGSRSPRSTGDEVRLVLDASVDSDAVLELARGAGRVTKFVFERRRLSELFREAVK